jgi:hypothetical protein
MSERTIVACRSPEHPLRPSLRAFVGSAAQADWRKNDRVLKYA